MTQLEEILKAALAEVTNERDALRAELAAAKEKSDARILEAEAGEKRAVKRVEDLLIDLAAANARTEKAKEERDRDLADLRKFQRDVISLTHRAVTAEAERDALKARLADGDTDKEEPSRSNSSTDPYREALHEMADSLSAVNRDLCECKNAHWQAMQDIHVVKADLTAVADQNAALRAALGKIRDRALPLGLDRGDSVTMLIAEEALAATPTQSLAAHDAEVKVAVLREMAGKLFKEAEVTECGTFYDAARIVVAEADRIEKEGANG